ncbi:NF-X1 finger and helicase domain protein [Fonsecaea pedrosoi]|nr:NF-X1 finger and helicase domain protein [Fonsecaea pedrosoi]
MQETVLILAKDGGLQRIKQVVERSMDGMSLNMRRKMIKEQAIPLCQVITHQHVLASTLLEVHVGTIYNFIYGVQGQRAVQFFKALIATIADCSQVDILPSEIEAVVKAFSNIIDCNTHALVNDDLRLLADSLFDVVAKLDEGEAHESRRIVNRINQRLGIGRELTGWKPPKTTALPKATFALQQDLPGTLSKDGPRHDNDCVNACDIQIMPTFEEINATRSEYLPSMNPQDWHLPGVLGLLDRHFRLLREDTVGQLRDAVRQEVQASHSIENRGKPQGSRKLTYDNARVVKIDFNRWQGLLITIGFDQPSHLRQRSAKHRKEWWEFQKRLRVGSLICLLSNGALIFCSVIERKPTKPLAKTDDSSSSDDEKIPNRPEKPQDLFSDPVRAFTTVSLVSDRTEAVLDLMKAPNSASAKIVEFPGVLLPSFEPTLRALRAMLRNPEMPFSEYLAPEAQADLSKIAAPYYATRPGFEFDLSCIMKDKTVMKIAVDDDSNHEAFRENSILDRAQADALLTSLQRSLALIQGPPGTGKSFTGVALIKVLIAIQAQAKLGPVLCVCYTNHALDQLLEDLVRHGIGQIVRIGSQSKSEILQNCNLRILASNIDLTKTERHEHWVLKLRLDEDERIISKAIKRLSLEGDVAALKSYLEIYYPKSYRTLFGGEDDDGFERVVRHKTYLLNAWRKGGSPQGPVRRLESLLEVPNIESLNHFERQRLYYHWLAESKKTAQAELLNALAQYKEHKERFDQVRAGVDLRCLQQAKIIGVTTTGLARTLPILRKLNSKVLVCEEAGEVLEAHILTALLPSLEHAILIGDHLQLPPHIQSYELSRESSLGKRHCLDISLFERLVTPSCSTQTAVPFSTLETQRRMHPSISKLIRNTLYPRLSDSSDVESYPPVAGLAKRLFWLDHAHHEDGVLSYSDATTSHSNTFEVQMVTALVSHLVRQGVYHTNDLAVLTPYLGQLQKIRRALQGLFEISLTEGDMLELEREEIGKDNDEAGHSVTPALQKTPLSRALKVSTIDNFQGEEAKVVIISLVRSNDQNKCGFLRTSNRVNVLLSRAKHGMYIIGDSRTSGHVPMWASVIDMLHSDDNFGESLPLQCPRHPQATFSVSKPDDFAVFSPEGGCNLPCEMRLSLLSNASNHVPGL